MDDIDVVSILDDYRGLVRYVANLAYCSSSALGVEDLIQVGELAVLSAIKSYNPSYGVNIRGFVARIVRQEVFAEAARFLGVFTVDNRTTNLGSRVSKMFASGKNYDEIATTLSSETGRNLDSDHVRDLRLAYERRSGQDVSESVDIPQDDVFNCLHIENILYSVVESDVDRVLIEKRILSKTPMQEVCKILNLGPNAAYEAERRLRYKIEKAIEDHV